MRLGSGVAVALSRPEAAVLILSLAWELSYATCTAIERKKKRKERKEGRKEGDYYKEGEVLNKRSKHQ